MPDRTGTAGRLPAPRRFARGADAWPVHPGRSGAKRGNPVPRRSLLATLLDVAADELLGVLLEHRVDLVQQVVDVFGQFSLALSRFGTRLGGRRLVDLLVAAGPAGL